MNAQLTRFMLCALIGMETGLLLFGVVASIGRAM